MLEELTILPDSTLELNVNILACPNRSSVDGIDRQLESTRRASRSGIFELGPGLRDNADQNLVSSSLVLDLDFNLN